MCAAVELKNLLAFFNRSQNGKNYTHECGTLNLIIKGIYVELLRLLFAFVFFCATLLH